LRGSSNLSRISQALETHYFTRGIDLFGAHFVEEEISKESWRVSATHNGEIVSEVVEKLERGLEVESCNKEAVSGEIFRVKIA
jgi:hypothetical protein